MDTNTPRTLLLSLALASAGGCYQGLSQGPDGGQGGGDDAAPPNDDEQPEPESEADEVAPLPLRRLSRNELRHTLDDLLGAPFVTELALPTDASGGHGFVEGGSMATVDARNLMNLAEEFAAAMIESPAAAACDPIAEGDAACAGRFAEELGRRAFRRHLEADEIATFVTLYQETREVAQLDHHDGLAVIVETMVQSPHFLYRRELGPHGAREVDGVVVLEPDEVASRLSYLLWSSIPDDELFAAADAGELATAEQLEAQARRMLEDPRATRMVDDFHLQWLEVDEVSSVVKDTGVFPAANAELMRSMEQETREFARFVILGEGDGTLEQLLTAPFSVIDDRLAALYGVAAPPEPATFARVALDPSQRAGILTQAAFLARHAGTAQSNPAKRGKTLSARLLCRPLPPPPNNVPELEPAAEGGTTRDRFEQHSENPECSGCHSLIDPLGFSLEHYDAVGGFRQDENGTPVDASSQLDLDGESIDFSSMVELAPLLSKSETVRDCVASQWFRYAVGRAEVDADEASMTRIQQSFEQSGFDVRELVIAIVSSPTFRERAASAGEEIQ